MSEPLKRYVACIENGAFYCKEDPSGKWVDHEQVAALEARCAELEFQNSDMADRLSKIEQWSNAYPIDMFPEPDFEAVRVALESHGISLGSVSASNMRHVIKQVAAISRGTP